MLSSLGAWEMVRTVKRGGCEAEMAPSAAHHQSDRLYVGQYPLQLTTLAAPCLKVPCSSPACRTLEGHSRLSGQQARFVWMWRRWTFVCRAVAEGSRTQQSANDGRCCRYGMTTGNTDSRVLLIAVYTWGPPSHKIWSTIAHLSDLGHTSGRAHI